MRELTINSSKPQLDALTGIRFLAASYVLLYHLNSHIVKPFFADVYQYTRFVLDGGWLGVDLFFLLSGFIISYNYHDKFTRSQSVSYFDFLIKRLARIYPAHLFTSLLVFIPIAWCFEDNEKSWSYTMVPDNQILELTVFTYWEFLKSVLLVQAWTLPTVLSWNSVSWSVSCEWLAYLVFPLLVILFRPLRTRKSLWFGMICLYLLLLTSIPTIAMWLKGNVISGLLRIATEFSAGILLYKLFALSPQVEYRPAWWKRCLLGLALLLSLTSGVFLAVFAISLPVFAYCIIALARGQIKAPLLTTPLLGYGGKISYSLYLCHGVMLSLMIVFIDPMDYPQASLAFRLGYIAVFLAGSLLLTLFCYHLVEEPARHWVVSLAPRKRQASAKGDANQLNAL